MREAMGLATLAPTPRLFAAGDLLRRSRALGIATSAVDEALAVLKPAEITACLASADVAGALTALTRALEDAFESGLGDDDGDRSTRISTALEALSKRDRIASAMAAIERWERA